MTAASHPWAGALLATASAVLYNTGFVLEKQALGRIAAIRASRPGQLLRDLGTSRRWLAGFTILLAGLALQVGALSTAPISVVQPIFAAGLLLLLVLSHLVLGERLSHREMAAVALVIVAVACLGGSLGPGGDSAGWRQENTGLALLVLPTLLIAGWCFRHASRWHPVTGEPRRLATAFYGLAAGAAYGVASVATKAVAAVVQRYGLGHALPHVMESPALYLLAATSAAGMVAFQIGLQRSPASVMIPVSNVVSSAYAVVVGSALFGEHLPAASWQAALRVGGLIGVLSAVAILAVRQPGDGRERVAGSQAPAWARHRHTPLRTAVQPDAEPAA